MFILQQMFTLKHRECFIFDLLVTQEYNHIQYPHYVSILEFSAFREMCHTSYGNWQVVAYLVKHREF